MKYIILLHKNGFGGIESYSSAIYQELIKKGYDVKIFCFKSPNRENIIFQNISGGYFGFFYEIVTTKNNKVIFNNSIPLLLSIFLPVTKISLIHGYPKRYLWFYNFLLKFGNHFFYANSIYLKERLRILFNFDLNIIYPLIRNKIIDESEILSKKKLLIESNSIKNFNLGYFGRISPEKNIETIVLFHNNILSQHKDVKFYLMGEVQSAFKERLLKLSLRPDNLIFLKYSIELNNFFSDVHINFCVTNKIESYGISIAETLLYNTRCVIPDYLEKDYEEIGNVFIWKNSYLDSIESSLNFYKYIQRINLVESRSLILRRNTLSLNKIL